MGLLDKAKQAAQQAQTQLSGATSSVGGAQQSKVADTWLKELGQWVYADRMGRDPRAAGEIEVRIQQLQSWEQQNGTQVPTPFASPGTSPAGGPGSSPGTMPGQAPVPGTMSDPAPVPGTFSEPQSIPGTMSDPAPIPGTISGAPEAPAAAGVPTPGGSLGPMDDPPSGEPMTPAPPSAAPPPPPPAPPPPPPAPPSPPSPPS